MGTGQYGNSVFRFGITSFKEGYMASEKTILVVDDDCDILESITMVLESAGYGVTAVKSGEECFYILRQVRPDLIILDIMMDTLTDGFHVCYELKSRSEWSTIPVILISSIEQYTGLSIDKEFLQVDEFFEKPFQPAVLLETVRKIFSRNFLTQITH